MAEGVDEAAARAVAEDVAESLCRYDFAAVVARFDPRMEQGLPRAELERMTHSELDQLGVFQARAGARSTTKEAFVTTTVECSFEGGVSLVQMTLDARGRIVGLFLEARPRARGWQPLAAALVMLAMPFGFAWLSHEAWGARALFSPFVIGTIGWVLSLSLRGPVTMAAKRFAAAREEAFVVTVSGAVEESVRLAAVATAGRAFSEAFSVGLGWASIEILFAAATLIGARRRGGVPDSPTVGVVERVSTTAFHIGSTLLIAKQPLFLVATILLRGLLGLGTKWLSARRVWMIHGITALAGAAVFMGGIAAFGRL